MRPVIRTIQVIVGVLFIISGLVKANDPMGLGYKMEEFFEVWNADLNAGHFFAKGALISLFDWLHSYALLLSIIMIAMEIIAGVALLIGYKQKFTIYLLLVLIVFFTFLTGYANFSHHPDGSPKFTNCGCFGDCLPIAPLTSFLKDLLLLVLIVALVAGRKHLVSFFTVKIRQLFMSVVVIVCLLVQWYALRYLPVVDCLPLKKGNNIAEQTKPPKGSTPSIYETRLIYKNGQSGAVKDMSQDEFNNSKIWEDSNWKWQETQTRLVKKGNDDPPIKGFSLTGGVFYDSASGNATAADSAGIVLSQPLAVLGFGLYRPDTDWMNDLKTIIAAAAEKKAPVYYATNNRDSVLAQLARTGISGVQVFACDYTIIRTAARVNPTFYILQAGTVKEKYGRYQLDRIAAWLRKP